MIEAVNSVVSNAPFLRSAAEPVDVARTPVANQGAVESAAPKPQAPYISPYIYVDVYNNKAVIQIRDSETGDVLNQFPSEEALQIRLRQAAANTVSAAPKTTKTEVMADTPSPDALRAQAATQALNAAAQTSAPPVQATVVTSA